MARLRDTMLTKQGKREMLLSWLIMGLEVWCYSLTPGVPGLFNYRDSQTQYAVLHFYPPTIITILLIGALFAAMITWPSIWLGRRLAKSRTDKGALGFALGSVIVLSGLWSVLIELVFDQLEHPGRIVQFWAVLAGLSVLPACTQFLAAKTVARKH